MKGLNLDSKMGRLAKEIEEVSFQGQEVNISYLYDKLSPEFSRKQISDWASNLIRRGYLEKIETGKYRATWKLHQAMGRDQEERPEEQKKEVSKKPGKVVVRRKSQEHENETGKERHEVDLALLINLLERFEACLDRLDHITERFHDQAELQRAVEVMEKALDKKKRNH